MKFWPQLRSALSSLRLWHFAVAFIVLLPFSIWQLRQNNLTMLSLRDVVVAVDAETADVTQVEPHLIELGNFVINHMNTTLAGPVELPGSYNAAVERARQEVERSGTANGQVYREAQELCERPSIPLTARAQCIQEYVLSNAAPGTNAQELIFPEKSLYSYNFASPAWSFDLAGVSSLLTIASATVVILGLGKRFVLKKIRSSIDSDPLE